VKLHGRIDYHNELVKLYKASRINLNITKVQHKSAVNPKVFDIACAGGFVLTDYRRRWHVISQYGGPL
jgi:spore maturation protein CgeB